VVIYSQLGSLLGFVPAVGPVLGAGIAEVFDWQGIFVTLAMLGAMAGIQAVWCWPETRPSRYAVARLAHVGGVLTNASFLIYTLGYSAASGAFFVFFSTSPRVLIGGHVARGLQRDLRHGSSSDDLHLPICPGGSLPAGGSEDA
jgi:MFS transporter, DHA1 family, chloramphenicol/florfenicol resistance protein